MAVAEVGFNAGDRTELSCRHIMDPGLQDAKVSKHQFVFNAISPIDFKTGTRNTNKCRNAPELAERIRNIKQGPTPSRLSRITQSVEIDQIRPV